MQNAKDTFYLTLQARLAALNPARTVVIRGVVRPGILVDENELPTSAELTGAFRLHWTDFQVDTQGPLPLVALQCSIRYATDGTTGNGGMDRGRDLSSMDGEISAALGQHPGHMLKSDYSDAVDGTPPSPMQTNLFWSDPTFGPAVAVGERLERTATVTVYAYQEEGEL